jgi:hypothetical protein
MAQAEKWAPSTMQEDVSHAPAAGTCRFIHPMVPHRRLAYAAARFAPMWFPVAAFFSCNLSSINFE